MQQVYIKKFTRQDITKSMGVCTESVESFWGISIASTGYNAISICNEKKPDFFPAGVTIHKGYQGEKDWRITGNGFKPLYKDDNPEEDDLFVVKKIKDKFVSKVIKKDTIEYKLFLSLFKGNDNYVIIKMDDTKDLPHQQIYYGAPGTGKSHKTKEVTVQYKDTIRTTFHPDSDYSTFVGAYKPTTEKEYMYGLNGDKTVLFKDPSTDEPLKTSKIEYKFVKQAFLKAYIKAWQKMSSTSYASISLTFNIGNDKYVIINVDDANITYKKESLFERDFIKKTWDLLWGSGAFVIPTGPQPGASIQQAISQWIYRNVVSCTKDDFDKGWDLLIEKLQDGESVVVRKDTGSQEYELKSCDDDSDMILVLSQKSKTKTRISECYENTKKSVGAEYGIIELLKKYNCSTFEDAWEKLKQDVAKASSTDKNIIIAPQFLVIEEINRGNCAQIFGDLFQLLDRKKGYSEYPIVADDDIRKALLEDNPTDELSFGSDGLQLSEDIKKQINEVCGDDTVADKVCKGEVLLLPPNLYIWATMNTSDQSLFPIDSAFKRRWEWEYTPIKYKNIDWVIDINGNQYSWVSFQRKVNAKIFDATNSEDKMLGDYFVNPHDGIITEKMLLNKILFYLWNDVCKDGEGDIFKISETETVTFSELHGEEGSKKLILMMNELKVDDIKISKPSEDVDLDTSTEKTEE